MVTNMRPPRCASTRINRLRKLHKRETAATRISGAHIRSLPIAQTLDHNYKSRIPRSPKAGYLEEIEIERERDSSRGCRCKERRHPTSYSAHASRFAMHGENGKSSRVTERKNRERKRDGSIGATHTEGIKKGFLSRARTPGR